MRASINLLFAGGLFFSSCTSGPSNLKEYFEWYTNPDHGFVRTREMKGVVYNIYYRPSDLMAAYELEVDRSYTKGELDSIKKTYQESDFFMLELIAKGNEHLEWNELKDQRYEDLTNNLSFNMKDKISIVIGKDTLDPTMYHYERGFELGSKQRFLFAFPKFSDTVNDFQVIYHDDLFNASIYKFSFSNIKDYPLLEDAII